MQVTLNRHEIAAFKRTFPCSGLPDLLSITFDYEANGDLCGITAVDEDGSWIDSADFDGAGLLALSQDCQPKPRLTTAFK
jgi:hypothetical protein